MQALHKSTLPLVFPKLFLNLEDPTNPRYESELNKAFGGPYSAVTSEAHEDILTNLPKYNLRAQVFECVDATKSEAFERIVKQPYACMVLDVNYQFDHDDDGTKSDDPSKDGASYTTGESLAKMLRSFADIQALSHTHDYTVIVFCGFLQCHDFYKVMREEFSRGKVFRYFWKKTPAKGAKNINPERPTNVLECIFVGIRYKIGAGVPEPWQVNYGASPEDRTNVLDVPSVVKKVRSATSDKNILGDWQKPRKLLHILLKRHACVPGRWVLEFMCGTATASLVALTLGMNVVASDWSKERVKVAGGRLTKLMLPVGDSGSLPSEEAEIRTKVQWKALLDERVKLAEEKKKKSAPPSLTEADCSDFSKADQLVLEQSTNKSTDNSEHVPMDTQQPEMVNFTGEELTEAGKSLQLEEEAEDEDDDDLLNRQVAVLETQKDKEVEENPQQST